MEVAGKELVAQLESVGEVMDEAMETDKEDELFSRILPKTASN